MEKILAALVQVAQVAQMAQRVGENISPYFRLIGQLIKKEPLTAEQQAQITADRKRLSATLQEPLPDESAEGESE